jgi:hypothetical protein
MTRGWQSKITKFLFAALFIFLSVLLISCSSSNNPSSLPSGDNNIEGGDNGDGDNGGGGGQLPCDFYIHCFEQYTDSNGDGIDDHRTWSCYIYDPENGNRSSAFSDYDEGADGSIQLRTQAIYDYDWGSNVLTITCEFDEDADGSVNAIETCKWELDSQGNRIKGVIDIDNDADDTTDAQRKESLTYDGHGEISTWVVELDSDMDGSIDSRSARTFTRTYDNGKILTTVTAFDNDGDGNVDARHSARNTYDGEDRIRCDIDYDNNDDGFFESRAIVYYTNDDDGNEIEEDGARRDAPNGPIDYRWTYSSNFSKICSNNLSKPLSPLTFPF